MRLHKILHYLGITRNYRGYQQVCMAVELVLERPERLHRIMHDVYFVVAKEYGCSPLCVERNIRTIIIKAWRCNYSRLCEIANCNLLSPPTVAEFVDLLSTYIDERKIG